MFKLCPTLAAVTAGLLAACATPPTAREMVVHPVLRISHSEQTAATYYLLGKYHQERGDLDSAIASYTHSIAIDSRQLESNSALAAILAQQGKFDEATRVLLQLVRYYPKVASVYNNLGYVYYMHGNYDAAVTTLERALSLDSAYERARNNLKIAQGGQSRPANSAHPLAPTATQTTSALSDFNRTQAHHSKTSTAPLPNEQINRESGKAVAAAPSIPPGSGLVIANSPSQSQTRMQLVQVMPNVYELKLKPAPVVPEIPVMQPPAAMEQASSLIGVTALKSSRVEVANGNGVTGMAKRIGRVLGQQGIVVSRLTNERPYIQQETKIFYRAGHQQSAIALNDVMKGLAQIMSSVSLSPRTDVRLVLGKDAIEYVDRMNDVGRSSSLAVNEAAN